MKTLFTILLLSAAALAQSSSASGTFTLQLVGNTVWNAGANGCPVAGSTKANCALPPMILGTPYSYSLSVNGGIPPYTWTSIGLPSCLTLTPSTTDTSQATLAGTPTAACTPSAGGMTVTVTDSSPKVLARISGANLTVGAGK